MAAKPQVTVINFAVIDGPRNASSLTRPDNSRRDRCFHPLRSHRIGALSDMRAQILEFGLCDRPIPALARTTRRYRMGAMPDGPGSSVPRNAFLPRSDVPIRHGWSRWWRVEAGWSSDGQRGLRD